MQVKFVNCKIGDNSEKSLYALIFRMMSIEEKAVVIGRRLMMEPLSSATKRE